MENIFKLLLDSNNLKNHFWIDYDIEKLLIFLMTLILNIIYSISGVDLGLSFLSIFLGWASITLLWYFWIKYLTFVEKKLNIEKDKIISIKENKIKELSLEFEKLEKDWNWIYKDIKSNIEGIIHIISKKDILKEEFDLKDLKFILNKEELKIFKTFKDLFESYSLSKVKVEPSHFYKGDVKQFQDSLEESDANLYNMVEMINSISNLKDSKTSSDFRKEFIDNFSNESLRFVLRCFDIDKGVFYLGNLLDYKLEHYEIKDLYDKEIKNDFRFLSKKELLKKQYGSFLNLENRNPDKELKEEIEEKLKQYGNKGVQTNDKKMELNKIYL